MNTTDCKILEEKKVKKIKYLININEELLIKEIEGRPELYDKNLKGYRKSILRHSIWEEIATNLNSNVAECRKRWRSLRDAFAKHYKDQSLQPPGKRKKWIFYDQMMFIVPYITNSSNSIQDSAILCDNSHDEDNIILENNDQIQISTIAGINDTALQLQQNQQQNTSIDLNVDNQFIKIFGGSYTSSSPLPTTTNTNDVLTNANSPIKKKDTIEYQINNIDSDESFLLSCAPVLKRLSTKKNSLARLKIQEILYSIEFGDVKF